MSTIRIIMFCLIITIPSIITFSEPIMEPDDVKCEMYFPELVVKEGFPIPVEMKLTNISSLDIQIMNVFQSYGPKIEIFKDSKIFDVGEEFFSDFYSMEMQYEGNLLKVIKPGEFIIERSYITTRYKDFPEGKYRIKVSGGEFFRSDQIKREPFISRCSSDVQIEIINGERTELRTKIKELMALIDIEKNENVKNQLIIELISFTSEEVIPLHAKYANGSKLKDVMLSLYRYDRIESDLIFIDLVKLDKKAWIERGSYFLSKRDDERLKKIIQHIEMSKDPITKEVKEKLKSELKSRKK